MLYDFPNIYYALIYKYVVFIFMRFTIYTIFTMRLNISFIFHHTAFLSNGQRKRKPKLRYLIMQYDTKLETGWTVFHGKGLDNNLVINCVLFFWRYFLRSREGILQRKIIFIKTILSVWDIVLLCFWSESFPVQKTRCKIRYLS